MAVDVPGGSRPLSCTVCITTHNRRDDLVRTLNRLRELQPPPDQIVVVADGCSDETVSLVEEQYPAVDLLAHSVACGSIPSRNEMARRTDCDIMLSLDDDSYPIEPGFIAAVRRHFEANPTLAILSFPQRTDEFPETLAQASFGAPRFVGAYANSGAAIRRSAFLEMGGYPDFFFHAYEEPDFALRCIAAGWEARFEPSLTIRHHFTSVGRNEVRTHHRHARNELWSVWMRCPWPQLPAVAVFRIVRQAGYAASRGAGWLLREPVWWLSALKGAHLCILNRKPIRWQSYRKWMQLVRHPQNIPN